MRYDHLFSSCVCVYIWYVCVFPYATINDNILWKAIINNNVL